MAASDGCKTVFNAECEIFEYIPVDTVNGLGSQASDRQSGQADVVSPDELDISPSKPRSEILEGLVTAKELSYGASLDGRIAHIHDLILHLSLESSDPRIQELDSQLVQISNNSMPQLAAAVPKESIDPPKPCPDVPQIDPTSLQKLQSLESRLAELESRVGGVGQSNVPDFASVLADINQRLDLAGMASEHIEETSRELVRVSTEHDAELASLANFDDVWARFQQLAPFIEQLPQVSARLRALASLHEYSASQVATNNELRASVTLIRESLRAWSSRLDSLERALN